jgi:sugar phosphate isomerase/epimerase
MSRTVRDTAAAEALGWRLAMQAYTFREFTFFEAVDRAVSLALTCIEMYPGQALSPEQRELRAGHELPAAARAAVKEKLASAGVALVNYGVVALSVDEAESRQVFDFARDMGVETIVSEPPFDSLDTVEGLCEEYGINVAIHNHPKPGSRYWNPQAVLEACKGRGRRLGACADTGHWMRSGIRPLEAIRKLEGRIISLHLKDLNEFGTRRAHDVPWQAGQADVKAILAEIKAQRFRGVFSIEYEHNWTRNLPEIAECIAAFDRLARELGAGSR